MLAQLKECYDAYCLQAEKVHRDAPGFAGMLGFGADPRNHACHTAFYEAVGAWVAEFLKSEPDAAAALAAAEFILGAADAHREEPSSGYLFAAQGHARGLLPLLTAEDCGKLARWYDSVYPKRERMPVQQEILKTLQKNAKKRK